MQQIAPIPPEVITPSFELSLLAAILLSSRSAIGSSDEIIENEAKQAVDLARAIRQAASA